jgi:hypothetical protein
LDRSSSPLCLHFVDPGEEAVCILKILGMM